MVYLFSSCWCVTSVVAEHRASRQDAIAELPSLTLRYHLEAIDRQASVRSLVECAPGSCCFTPVFQCRIRRYLKIRDFRSKRHVVGPCSLLIVTKRFLGAPVESVLDSIGDIVMASTIVKHVTVTGVVGLIVIVMALGSELVSGMEGAPRSTSFQCSLEPVIQIIQLRQAFWYPGPCNNGIEDQLEVRKLLSRKPLQLDAGRGSHDFSIVGHLERLLQHLIAFFDVSCVDRLVARSQTYW